LVGERILSLDEVGEYRKNNIEDGVLAIEVPYQMEDFWLWFSKQEKEIHPLVLVAIFLFEMRRLKPLSYANEVVSRLWIYYFLSIKGYSMRDLLIFSDWSLVKEKEVNVFVEMFLEKVLFEAERIRDRLKRVEMEKQMLDKSGRQLPLSVRQILLIEEFQSRGEMRMREMRMVLPGVSDDTILRELRDLEEKKMIRKKGSTKGAKYIYVV
jgi:Fic family protein